MLGNTHRVQEIFTMINICTMAVSSSRQQVGKEGSRRVIDVQRGEGVQLWFAIDQGGARLGYSKQEISNACLKQARYV